MDAALFALVLKGSLQSFLEKYGLLAISKSQKRVYLPYMYAAHYIVTRVQKR